MKAMVRKPSSATKWAAEWALKRKQIGAFFVILAMSGQAQQTERKFQYPFQNPTLPAEQRVSDLLSRLTLQEKIDLLGKSLNVPRLGIHGSGTVDTLPGSGGQFEGLHGLAMGGPGNWGRKSPGGEGAFGGTSTIPTTQFPQASALGETWDPALLQKVAAEEGYEARYIFQTWDRGGLIIRAPNADLARDPRWGRNEESYGEDPYLTGKLAVAYVRGLQGSDARYWLTSALVKHFMANSNEDNREVSSSNFDERLMQEYYTVPFRMAIEEGKANAIMAALNAVNGIPMTANLLLKELTSGWGFDGLVDTDRGALTFLVTKHKYFPDAARAVAGAMHAGVNQFLNPYQEALRNALDQNLVSDTEIDQNLRGVCRVLLRLGMLDPDKDDKYSRIRKGTAPAPWEDPGTVALVQRATRESIVLLKNSAQGADGPLLPLNLSKLKSIAIAGPRANEVLSDFYGGTAPFTVTPLEGIKSKVGERVSVRYAVDHDEAVQFAKSSDVAIVVIGNHPTCGQPVNQCSNPTEGKEAVDRRQISLDPEQEKLVEDVNAANPRTVVVLISGFPYTVNWIEKYVPAILHMGHSSEQEGAALADVLFGDYNPAGRLVQTWVASEDQLPPMMDYDIRHGRTYMYLRGTPLYPFGFGLSYTAFAYSHLKISSGTLRGNGDLRVSIDLRNSGKQAGEEVVQLYVSHKNSKVDRPIEQLEGFERIHLAAGESRTLSLPLSAKAFKYWDVLTKQWKLEPEQVDISVGASSADIRATKSIKVVP